MAGDKPFIDWRTQGSCAKLSISEVEKLFFPTNGRTIKRAKEFCETQCLVYEKCLEWATHVDRYMEKGIIAGLSEKERRAIQRVNRPEHFKTNGGSFKKKTAKRVNFKVT